MTDDSTFVRSLVEDVFFLLRFVSATPWKFNIAPENGWLEDEFPFGKAYFQGLC